MRNALSCTTVNVGSEERNIVFAKQPWSMQGSLIMFAEEPFPGNGPRRVQGLLFYKIFTLYVIYSESFTSKNKEQRLVTKTDGSITQNIFWISMSRSANHIEVYYIFKCNNIYQWRALLTTAQRFIAYLGTNTYGIGKSANRSSNAGRVCRHWIPHLGLPCLFSWGFR